MELLGNAVRNWSQRKRRNVAGCAVISVAFGGFPADAAAEVGPVPTGSFIVQAERVMGIASHSFKRRLELGGPTAFNNQTVRHTTIALFGGSPATGGVLGSSLLPRLGFDYTFGPGATLGGSGTYARISGDRKSTSGLGGFEQTSASDQPTISEVVLHPRIGYAIGASDRVAVWARVGAVYSSLVVKQEDSDGTTTDDVTISSTNLSGEFLLVLSPVPNAGLVIGPFLELPLSARVDGGADVTEGADIEFSYTGIGVAVGIALIL